MNYVYAADRLNFGSFILFVYQLNLIVVLMNGSISVPPSIHRGNCNLLDTFLNRLFFFFFDPSSSFNCCTYTALIGEYCRFSESIYGNYYAPKVDSINLLSHQNRNQSEIHMNSRESQKVNDAIVYNRQCTSIPQWLKIVYIFLHVQFSSIHHHF